MKLANTGIALVLLAVLGGAFFYLNKHPDFIKNPKTNTALPKKKLFTFQASQVKQFSIEEPNQPAVVVRRVSEGKPKAHAKGKWEIVSPAGVPADNSSIQSFVDGLPKFQDTPLGSQTPGSLAEYGLDHPERTVQFELTKGKPVTLLIGKKNPSGYARYGMLKSPSGLFLLDSIDAKDLIKKSLFDLRDKRVLPVAVNKARQLALRFHFKPAALAQLEKARKLGLPIKPPKIVMTKQPNGNWQLTDPHVRTDFGDTNYLVTTVQGGLMKSVAAEHPKSLRAYGLDPPPIRLDVTAADGSVHSLLIGDKATKKSAAKNGKEKENNSSGKSLGYYAKNSDWPTVFTINDPLFDQLNQDLDDYRNRFLFDFDTGDARRVEIQGPTGKLRLDRKGENWFRGPEDKTKLDKTKVETFLNSIHALRIQRYADDHPHSLGEYGLSKPWMRVKVTFGEANKVETVVFGKKGKKFYAARVDEPSVYEMSPTEPKDIQTKLKAIS